MKAKRNRLILILCLLLAGLILLAYWPLAENKFVNVDDTQYLSDNPNVTSGLTLTGLRWALTSGYASNWHPVTWISHMLDCSLFGLNPAGHHLTSLGFHVINSVLLFLLLCRLTLGLWPSLFVALFFGLHPTHVESVAWAAERKDVLSGFFFLLTLWAYGNYVSARAPDDSGLELRRDRNTPHQMLWYIAALFLYALALMSKPMVVTLPFVLLLLDFWPFRRLTLSFTHSESHRPAVPRSEAFSLRRFAAYAASSFPLIREKIPFLVLSFLASLMTFRAQSEGGAVASLTAVPLAGRIANAAVSYLRYLFETIWPVNLSPIYVHPGPWPSATILISVVVLVVVTVLVSAVVQRHPHLFVGWFWFLGVLVPVLGLVQVGAQAMADRYLYLPSIGLYVAIVWGAAELAGVRAKVPSPLCDQRTNADPAAAFFLAPSNRLGRGVVLLGIVALAGCMLCTWFQVQYWRNGRTLYQHALSIDPNNYVAYDYLGKALLDEGRDQDALALFRNSVRLDSGYSEAQYNLGTLLLTHGLANEAVLPLERAVELTPGDGNAHHQLANAYLQLGRLPEAADEYVRAMVLKPTDAGIRASLGTVLLRQGNLPEAAARFSQALSLEPNHVEAHRNLGVVLASQGKGAEAILQFGEAVRLRPTDPDLRFNLGLALLENNRPREAEQQFREILQLKPDDSRAHFRLAAALRQQRESSGAVAEYRQTLRLYPDFPEALNELAWILATDPDPGVRNGTEAVTLANKACNLTKDSQPTMIFTLAAAYAENGQFAEAMAAAQKTHLLAENSGQSNLVSKSDAALKQFQSAQPLRDAHSFQ